MPTEPPTARLPMARPSPPHEARRVDERCRPLRLRDGLGRPDLLRQLAVAAGALAPDSHQDVGRCLERVRSSCIRGSRVRSWLLTVEFGSAGPRHLCRPTVPIDQCLEEVSFGLLELRGRRSRRQRSKSGNCSTSKVAAGQARFEMSSQTDSTGARELGPGILRTSTAPHGFVSAGPRLRVTGAAGRTAAAHRFTTCCALTCI